MEDLNGAAIESITISEVTPEKFMQSTMSEVFNLKTTVASLQAIVVAQTEDIKFLKHHLQRVRQLGGDLL